MKTKEESKEINSSYKIKENSKSKFDSKDLKLFKNIFKRATKRTEKDNNIESNKNNKRYLGKSASSVNLRNKSQNSCQSFNKSANNSQKEIGLNGLSKSDISEYISKIKYNMRQTRKNKKLFEFDEVDNIQLVTTNFIISNLQPKKVEIISAADYKKLCGNNYVNKSTSKSLLKSVSQKKINPKNIPKIKKKTYKALCKSKSKEEFKKREKILKEEERKRNVKKIIIPIDDKTYKKLMGENKISLTDEEMKKLLLETKGEVKKEVQPIDEDTYQKLLGNFEIPPPIRKINH